MRLHAEERKHAGDGALGEAGLGGGGANGPVCAFGRLLAERGAQQAGDSLLVAGSRRARRRGLFAVRGPTEALLEPLLPPVADGRIAEAEAIGGRDVRFAISPQARMIRARRTSPSGRGSAYRARRPSSSRSISTEGEGLVPEGDPCRAHDPRFRSGSANHPPSTRSLCRAGSQGPGH